MPLTPAPAVPASTIALTNPFGQTCSVAITGGTVTAVLVNAVQVASGTGVNVSVPPGGTISITYSVAPTWTWTNPPDFSPSPGYAAENTGSVNQYGNLPYAVHAEGGQSGFGGGVSN
jgi:hypothetical protein